MIWLFMKYIVCFFVELMSNYYCAKRVLYYVIHEFIQYYFLLDKLFGGYGLI